MAIATRHAPGRERKKNRSESSYSPLKQATAPPFVASCGWPVRAAGKVLRCLSCCMHINHAFHTTASLVFRVYSYCSCLVLYCFFIWIVQCRLKRTQEERQDKAATRNPTQNPTTNRPEPTRRCPMGSSWPPLNKYAAALLLLLSKYPIT
jgi:hypothetical protein